MNKPEWGKELNECKTELEGTINANKTQLEGTINSNKTQLETTLNSHKTQSNIHRAIYVSTATPSASDGANGDIWLTIEA